VDKAAFSGMSDFHLYAIAVLIWGSTWLAIKFQLGTVPPAVSVVWRFGLAAAILFFYAAWKRMPLRFSGREHAWIALQGLSMFGINYIAVYVSEESLASGLVAVIFSLMAFFNIVAMRAFYATPLEAKSLFGCALGIGGVVLVFWPEIASFSATGNALLGAALALAATAVATLGNIAATRNQRAGMAIVPLNAWAMLYGAAFVALYAVLNREPFAFDWSFPYVASLAYLSLFGSVVAFGAYLALMARIGPHRAGYSSVAIPVVALLLSTLFENLQWGVPMVVGIALCLSGNLLVLSLRNS
jgi:drug/metabolite transporter (DMT)-like permease